MKFWLTALLLLVALPLFASPAPPLPAQRTDWLNGKALTWKDLRGKVVLLNVWTFKCWNSYRSLPWVVSMQKKFPDLQVIGVHSPEFESERNRNGLRETMGKYSLNAPQILDDEHDYWNQLNNHYWPAFYVVDKKGEIRGMFTGETHEGDSQAKAIEQLIARLVREQWNVTKK